MTSILREGRKYNRDDKVIINERAKKTQHSSVFDRFRGKVLTVEHINWHDFLGQHMYFCSHGHEEIYALESWLDLIEKGS